MITSEPTPSPPAPSLPPVAATHKTEVKTLVKKGDLASKGPAPQSGGDGASVEELRRTKSSPLVRKIAEEHGIDIKQLEGTGMSGRVTKNDILSFIESGSATGPAATAPVKPTAAPPVPAPSAAAPNVQQSPAIKPAEGDRVEQMSVMRKKIAEHMVLSRRTSATSPLSMKLI